jgi:hypothetical protein
MIRRVAQISELDWQSSEPVLLPLFEWKKATGRLERLHEDAVTPLLERTGKFLQVTDAQIRENFEAYVETLESLVKEQRFTPNAVVAAFDRAHAGLNMRTIRSDRVDSVATLQGDDGFR